jgi:hypothetical protein
MMNRRNYCLVLLGVVAFALVGLPSEGKGGVNVTVSVNGPPLPAYVVPAPPPVVIVPGTYVYCAPDLGVDMFFYGGFWYRPYGGHWYQARSYNGPWVYAAPARVPHAIATLPPGYRSMMRGHDRIPYGQLKKNWARWERERYWESRPDWRGPDRRPHEERDWGPGREDRGGRGGRDADGHGRNTWEQHGPGFRGDQDRGPGDHRGR